MSKGWLWWLGEFGLAAIVAIVAGFVTTHVPISIVYGLFVGTVFFVLREHRRVVAQQERQVSMMEDKALNLPPTFTHLEIVDPHMRRLIERERSELLRLAKEVAEGKILLRSRPVWQITNDFHKLAKPGDRIIATSHLSCSSTISSAFLSRFLSALISKRDATCPIMPRAASAK